MSLGDWKESGVLSRNREVGKGMGLGINIMSATFGCVELEVPTGHVGEDTHQGN